MYCKSMTAAIGGGRHPVMLPAVFLIGCWVGPATSPAQDAPLVFDYHASFGALRQLRAGRFKASEHIQGAKAIRLVGNGAAPNTGPLFAGTASDQQIELEFDWPQRGRKPVARIVLDGRALFWEWESSEIEKIGKQVQEFEKHLHQTAIEVRDDQDVVAKYQFFRPQELTLNPSHRRRKETLSRKMDGLKIRDDGSDGSWLARNVDGGTLQLCKGEHCFEMKVDETSVSAAWDDGPEKELSALQSQIIELEQATREAEKRLKARGHKAPDNFEKVRIVAAIRDMQNEKQELQQRCREIHKVLDRRASVDLRGCRARVELENGVVVARLQFGRSKRGP